MRSRTTSALVAAVAANPLPSDPAARARFHVARTIGARAELLSSLLSLYCAVVALSELSGRDGAELLSGDVVTMVGLAILAGVYVGGAT